MTTTNNPDNFGVGSSHDFKKELIEYFVATVRNTSEHMQFYWYLVGTGLVEIGVLIHSLNPKTKAGLDNK